MSVSAQAAAFLSPKWKSLRSLSSVPPRGTGPSALVLCRQHLLLWVKNDLGKCGRFSDCGTPRVAEGGFCPPVDTESTLGTNGLSKFTF